MQVQPSRLGSCTAESWYVCLPYRHFVRSSSILLSRSRLPREHRAHRAAVSTWHDPDTRTLRTAGVRARPARSVAHCPGKPIASHPDGHHVNRGRRSEAERLEQKLAEEKREEELQRLRNYGRPRWLQRHESAKPALAAEEEQREREQKAAHGIKMKAMAAAEEVQRARPTICSAL